MMVKRNRLPRKRRKGMGKAKGAGFEREVCKALSLWVSRGKDEDLFWRSAMSGGRATVAKKKGKALARQAGDITATAPEGHALTDAFFIECKFVKALRLDLFVQYGQGPLSQYWETARVQAALHKRAPMLICKENAGEVFVIMSKMDAALYSWAGGHAFAEAWSNFPAVTLIRWQGMLLTPFTNRARLYHGNRNR